MVNTPSYRGFLLHRDCPAKPREVPPPWSVPHPHPTFSQELYKVHAHTSPAVSPSISEEDAVATEISSLLIFLANINIYRLSTLTHGDFPPTELNPIKLKHF